MMNLLGANITRMRNNTLFRVGILFGAALRIICPLGAELGFWLSELTNGTVSLGLIAEKPILDYYFFYMDNIPCLLFRFILQFLCRNGI